MVQELINNDQIQAFCESMQGGRCENQDYCTGKALDARHAVLVVCDGMGGAAGGRQASFIAAHTIVDEVAAVFHDQNIPADQKPSTEEILINACQKANLAVYNKGHENIELTGMGSTAVVLYLTPEAAYMLHAGDSRGYQLRNGKKIFRTNDHSRVFELVEMGIYTEEQARTAPGNNIICRAMGLGKSINMELHKIPYRRSDRFMLCCDGIWNTMPEKTLLKYFAEHNSLQQVVGNVTKHVDELGRQSNMEYDNLTLLGIEVATDSIYQYTLKEKFSHWLNKWKKKRKPKQVKPAKPQPRPMPTETTSETSNEKNNH